MTVLKTHILALALVAAMPVQAAVANPPLSQVAEIEDTLYYAAIAHEIRKYCGSIDARMFKAMNMMWALRARANELGYSDKEIRAYVESDAEKARMRAKGEAYLAAHGVSYDNPESFCVLGRAEINKNSRIGVLLKAK